VIVDNTTYQVFENGSLGSHFFWQLFTVIARSAALSNPELRTGLLKAALLAMTEEKNLNDRF